MKNIAFALLAIALAGCVIKTESEIKPIHITMDVNLKVDKELDKAFSEETAPKPQGAYAEVKAMIDRKAAGITNLGALEAREGATDDDKMLIAETNSKMMRRCKEIAKDSGVALESVQKRRAKKMVERVPAGSGIWYQDEAGDWKQK